VPSSLSAVLAEIAAGAIRFDLDRADLDEGARRVLDRLSPLLLADPDVVLVVRGFTDTTGSADVNGPLSVARAQAVADYLLGRGVPAERLQVVGYGDAFPVADNGTDDGRQANRRSDATTGSARR
jgi:OOP family OmpA-OmpF porin